MLPKTKFTGSTVAKIKKYVGEHDVNIGPRERPSRYSFFTNFDFGKKFILFQKFGNKINRETRIISNPEKVFKLDSEIFKKSVEYFKRKVNKKIEIERVNIIFIGFSLFPKLPDKTIGNTGKTQGVKAVNIPATRDINNIYIFKSIIYTF